MEKSVLALFICLAVMRCVAGYKHAHQESNPKPPGKTHISPRLGARFIHPDDHVSNLAVPQPWNTSAVAQLQDFIISEYSYLEVGGQDSPEGEARKAGNSGRGERSPRSNKIHVVRENGLGEPAVRTALEGLLQSKFNRRRAEDRSNENTAGTIPVPGRVFDFTQLTCSLESELGLVVLDTSCAVAAVASSSCARMHTKDVQYDSVSVSPDVDFDFSSSNARRRSALHREESAIGGRSVIPGVSRSSQLPGTSAPMNSEGASGGQNEADSDDWELRAAVIVRVARSAFNEDLILWISAPHRTLQSTDSSREAKSGADVSRDLGPSPCWRVEFRPARGWSESLLRVQSLPVMEGRYSAWVVRREAVVARHAVHVAIPSGQQKSLEVQTVSDEKSVAASRALPPSQDSKIHQDNDEEIVFFHSSENDAEDLSTTSDPWQPPVVERPHLAENLHPVSKMDNKLTDRLATVEEKSNGLVTSKRFPLFLEENKTRYSVTSRETFIDRGDDSSALFGDFVSRTHFVRMKRSLDCKECVKKMKLEHEYDATTAIFVLRVTFNCSAEDCCRKCDGTVNMQQYQDSISAAKCTTLPISVQSFLFLYPVTDAGYISVDSPYSIKLSTGCYLATVDIGEQAHHGFTWLRPHTEPPDLNAWNTTFYLEPQPQQGAVKVQWTQPQYPQNFSRYSLQLWYQADRPLNCSGYHTDSSDMMQVHPTPSLPLDEPKGVFEGLEPGWYCARVTPLDSRCPRDGCAVRASHAVLLKNSSAPLPISTSEYPPEETHPRATFIAAVIGASVFVVLVTAAVAFFRFKWVERTRMSTTGPFYHKVSQLPSPPSERPCLLLVWTKRADSKGRHAAAVAALRRLLSTHFVVWDYLDLLSLPPLERDKVLENPAGWLYTAVHNPRVKVVLVSSAGAEQWRRAVQEGSCAETAAVPQTDTAVPLDVQLFPYLLQLLLHDPALVADYSKVFIVRFAPIADGASIDEGGEDVLGGLVQGLRYSLPFHLGLLSSALLGASKKQQREGIELSYPRTLFQELEETCQHLADARTQPSSNFVKVHCPLPAAKLGNGVATQHQTSGDDLC